MGDEMFHHTYLGTLAVTYKNAVNIYFFIYLFYNENNRSVIF